MTKNVILKKGREEPLRRRHPWVFSGAVHRTEGDPVDGDRVRVCDAAGSILGWGHFHNGSIQVKVIRFGDEAPSDTVFPKALEEAWSLRKRLGLGPGQATTGYRLVHGEGDNLPGLVIDVYGSVAVVQAHTIGMHRELPLVAKALTALQGPGITAVYNRSANTLPPDYAQQAEDGYLVGQGAEGRFLENGLAFHAHWETGQKTGFFLDQRDNRALLGHYAGGQRVLNAFCYTGGFSAYALRGGATQVESVDVSKKALEQLQDNLTANGMADAPHRSLQADVLHYLRQEGPDWDIVVLDPPAFAKSIHKRHAAVQGYKRLNALGISRVKPGGLLFTFSCSQVVDTQLFRDTVLAGCLEAGRRARVLHVLSQAPDHPVNLALPETSYLKGLVLEIRDDR